MAHSEPTNDKKCVLCKKAIKAGAVTIAILFVAWMLAFLHLIYSIVVGLFELAQGKIT